MERINPVLNVYSNTEINDLFWTRDLDGYYWICRVIGKAEPHFDPDLDIGALLPIKAYCVGLEVPGQIKASFNRVNGGTAEAIKDEKIYEYSKYIYTKIADDYDYTYTPIRGDFLDNLPALDLEELVIAYLQIEKNYYVLSNSIANRSTTIKIECELMSRDPANLEKAVVQVKAGSSSELDFSEFKEYADKGYLVYLFASHVKNIDKMDNARIIDRVQLYEFYQKYKAILPYSLTKWEDLFKTTSL